MLIDARRLAGPGVVSPSSESDDSSSLTTTSLFEDEPSPCERHETDKNTGEGMKIQG